jgi:predicted RNA methylase
VTLLHVADRTATPSIVGLERDPESAALAASVCRRAAGERIRVEPADGCDYDFGAADVVYVANLVQPKPAVVARVAQTARAGAQVVVREPVAAGALLAERGLDPAPAGLTLLAEGAGDARFLSRELFLEARR